MIRCKISFQTHNITSCLFEKNLKISNHNVLLNLYQIIYTSNCFLSPLI